MPILPVVYAIADAQFVFDVLLTHESMDIDREIEEKVIVTAVEEPFHGSELLNGSLIGVADEVEGRMLLDRLLHKIDLVVNAGFLLLSAIVIKPGTHGIA